MSWNHQLVMDWHFDTTSFSWHCYLAANNNCYAGGTKDMGGKRESFPILKMDGFIANNPNRNHFLHSNMTERGAYLTHPATNGNIKERFATNTRVDQVIFPPWPVDPRSLEVTISNHLSERVAFSLTIPKRSRLESPGTVFWVSIFFLIFFGSLWYPKMFQLPRSLRVFASRRWMTSPSGFFRPTRSNKTLLILLMAEIPNNHLGCKKI